MKKMKKLTSLLLAAVMVFGMAVTASANPTTQSGEYVITLSDEKGKITVTSAVAEQTYTIYKILDLLSYDKTIDTNPSTTNIIEGAYTYVIEATSPWLDFITTGAGKAYMTKGDSVMITVDDPATPGSTKEVEYFYVNPTGTGGSNTGAALAAAAIEYAHQKNLAGTDSKGTGANNGKLVFSDLSLGYYLMESTVGALCALTTTAPDMTIAAKNESHTQEKEVTDSRLEDLVHNTDPNNKTPDGFDDDTRSNNTYIGQTVDFTITVIAGRGAENLVIHDRMSKGLTLNKDSIKVYVAAPEDDPTTDTVEKNVAKGIGPVFSDYSVAFDVDCTDPNASNTPDEKHTFHVVLNNDSSENFDTNTKITVKYTAVVNSDAVIGSTGNPNDSMLTFGTDNHTTWSTTHTYTWNFEVFKFTNSEGSSVSRIPLDGAVFGLRAKSGTSTPMAYIRFVNITPGVAAGEPVPDNVVPVYRVATQAERDSITPKDYTKQEYPNNVGELGRGFITNSTGKFQLVGLDIGDYELVELEAPAGFNIIDEPIPVVIDSQGHVNPDTSGLASKATTTGNVIEVLNQSGKLLPETGGMGTTIFYVLGSVLALSAGVLFVTKKRMGYED